MDLLTADSRRKNKETVCNMFIYSLITSSSSAALASIWHILSKMKDYNKNFKH